MEALSQISRRFDVIDKIHRKTKMGQQVTAIPWLTDGRFILFAEI